MVTCPFQPNRYRASSKVSQFMCSLHKSQIFPSTLDHWLVGFFSISAQADKVQYGTAANIKNAEC